MTDATDMKRILVVVDETDASRRLVRTAGDISASMGGELVILNVMSTTEFMSRQQASEAIPALQRENGYYHLDHAKEQAAQVARRSGSEELADLGVSYTSVGIVGDRTDSILTTAERYGCEHVFLTSQSPRWWSRYPFDTTAQTITRRFTGSVTVLLEKSQSLTEKTFDYFSNKWQSGTQESGQQLSDASPRLRWITMSESPYDAREAISEVFTLQDA
jgi:nucleotide-binding universal stress UspA family protein